MYVCVRPDGFGNYSVDAEQSIKHGLWTTYSHIGCATHIRAYNSKRYKLALLTWTSWKLGVCASQERCNGDRRMGQTGYREQQNL